MNNTFPFRKVHAWSVSPSLAANKFAVGLLGNLFTEELAGRVLTAESPGRAKLACSLASLLFGFIGLSPAILGVWAKSQGILQAEGQNLCDESQDQVIGLAVQRLIPGELFGKEQILVAILILESLNTVDTSILMCGKVMANQARRLQMFDGSWADHAAIVLALSVSVLEMILFQWKVMVAGQVFVYLFVSNSSQLTLHFITQLTLHFIIRYFGFFATSSSQCCQHRYGHRCIQAGRQRLGTRRMGHCSSWCSTCVALHLDPISED